MVIEQIVDIPADHRIFLDVPPDVPAGKARVAATIIPVAETPDVPSGLSLSERFAGSVRLSDEEYEKWQEAVRHSRDEWNRNIF
jgi:hypothetical protein